MRFASSAHPTNFPSVELIIPDAANGWIEKVLKGASHGTRFATNVVKIRRNQVAYMEYKACFVNRFRYLQSQLCNASEAKLNGIGLTTPSLTFPCCRYLAACGNSAAEATPAAERSEQSHREANSKAIRFYGFPALLHLP
jgi:hypothetical protein